MFARGARSARKAGTALTSILQPFNRLLISWSGKGEAGQLTAAEFDGAVSTLPPDRLVSGFYLNELLLKLFARHDSHPEVFSLYGATLDALKVDAEGVRPLRLFEKRLLDALGYGLALEREVDADRPLDARYAYRYRLDQGAMRIEGVAEGVDIFSGRTLLARCARGLLRPGGLRRGARAAACRAGSLPGRQGVAHAQVMLALRRRDRLSISSMLHLGVNVDHVATLRQARRASFPDPVFAALIAEQAGADNITMHLREDRRHIQDRDIRVGRDVLQTRLNFEMAATEEMVRIACEVRPADCCLVPERRTEVTTEGGLDAASQVAALGPVCRRLARRGHPRLAVHRSGSARSSKRRRVSARRRSSCTPARTQTRAASSQARELQRLRDAARNASSLGLIVHAGHGMNYQNVQPIAAIRDIVELNIGHAIVARSLIDGMARAVSEMKRLMVEARAASAGA